MRLNYCAWLAFAAICVSLLAVYCSAAEEKLVDLHHNEQVAEPERPAPGPPPRQRFQLPKIFDFELYKRLFKRAYHGVEESVRRKLMLARAFRAWISSLKYKYRKSSYYLSINHLSDKSPEELERMENHHLDEDDNQNTVEIKASEQTQPGQSIPEVDPNHIEENLEKLVNGDSQQVEGLKELQDELKKQQASSRTKRNADHHQKNNPRDFDLDKLITTGENVSLDAETAQKVQWRPPSNNPNYEAPEMTSFGLRDENVEDMSWYKVNLPKEMKNIEKEESPIAGVYSFFAGISGFMNGVISKGERSESGDDNSGGRSDSDNDDDDDADHLPDEVFFDHRDSKCMFLPRVQGNCGSCYAFVAVAIAEWIHCMETGKLVAFSEQYLVDCGKGMKLSGCEGGNKRRTAQFIHNYGLELRVNYPYRARVDECPYDEDTDPKTMGYIRMELDAGTQIPVKLFEKYIPSAPMVLGISTKNGFHEYGGGVMDGAGCQPKSTHAVTLIGHGREDGREYWLIRNSHGVGWGEKGHYKLAKDSNCIPEEMAVMYGTDNGEEFMFRLKENRRNDPEAVKTHYSKKLLESLETDEI